MPQRAMTRASASPLQHKPRLSRQAGGERGASPQTDTQQPAHLTHTARNEWRRGCLPQGIKKPTTLGGCSTTSSPRNPNGWGSINSCSGDNNPNKPWQRVGYLSELLIDHSRLETSHSSPPLWDTHTSHMCHTCSCAPRLFLASVLMKFLALLLWL